MVGATTYVNRPDVCWPVESAASSTMIYTVPGSCGGATATISVSELTRDFVDFTPPNQTEPAVATGANPEPRMVAPVSPQPCLPWWG